MVIAWVSWFLGPSAALWERPRGHSIVCGVDGSGGEVGTVTWSGTL